MNSEKLISLSRQWIADCREALLAPAVRENPSLYVQNVREIYEQSLFIGLVFWRTGQSPVRDLNAAVDELDAHAEQLGSSSVATALPIASAGLIRTLLGLPHSSAAGTNEGSAPDVELDAQLLLAIESVVDESTVAALLKQLERGGSGSLAVRSYETYFALLTQGASPELLKSAEANYRARAKDRFYSGGRDSEGGGPNNSMVVDYRLGAVLKRLGYIGESVHLWQW